MTNNTKNKYEKPVSSGAILIDPSEVQIIRRGMLPVWFRESLNHNLKKLAKDAQESGDGCRGY